MLISQVVATVRIPDGHAHGQVDGLVLREDGLLVVIDRTEVKRRAAAGCLPPARVPGAHQPVEIEPHDGPNGELQLRLKTGQAAGDDASLALPIWDRERACWVNPLRPGTPGLAGPGSGG